MSVQRRLGHESCERPFVLACTAFSSDSLPPTRAMGLDRRSGISVLDVMDRVLDKGIVVDYHARVHVLGIDVLTTIQARSVVASIDTYLHHADAIRSVHAARGVAHQ